MSTSEPLDGFLSRAVGRGGDDLSGIPLKALRLQDAGTKAAKEYSDEAILGLIEGGSQTMGSFLSPSRADLEDVLHLIRLPHTPTVAAANSVAKHPGLPQAGIDYVLQHGGKVALRLLIERSSHALSLPTALEAQRLLFERFNCLYVPDGIRLGVPSGTIWHTRAFLSQSVQLLGRATSTHRKDRQFDVMAEAISARAWFAGIPHTDPSGRPVEAPTPEEIVSNLQNVGRSFSGTEGAAVLNGAFLRHFAQLPREDQEPVYAAISSWTLLNRVEDPWSLVDAVGAPSGSSRDPLGGVPSPRTLKLLDVGRLWWWSHLAALASSMLDLFRREFGQDERQWSMLQSLFDDWSGTIGELVETVNSV